MAAVVRGRLRAIIRAQWGNGFPFPAVAAGSRSQVCASSSAAKRAFCPAVEDGALASAANDTHKAGRNNAAPVRIVMERRAEIMDVLLQKGPEPRTKAVA